MNIKLNPIYFIFPVCILCFCFFTSCKNLTGTGIPKDKQEYIGTWKYENPEIILKISPDGRIDYSYKAQGTNKNIQAPIQKFEGNNFVAGALGIHTTFIVSQPPHLSGNSWQMTVDGRTLIRE